MPVKARLSRPLQILGQCVPAQGHQEDILERLISPKHTRDLVPIHARQPDVAEYDLGTELARPAQAGRSVVGDLDLMAAEFERLTQTLSCVGLVLDNQYAPDSA